MLFPECVQIRFGSVVLRTVSVQLTIGYRVVCEPVAVFEPDIAPPEAVERGVPLVAWRAHVVRWVYGKRIPCREAVWLWYLSTLAWHGRAVFRGHASDCALRYEWMRARNLDRSS